jgi:SAM-dependent methyltransferase/uncharacterized protein YbaR (Trm112 family)
MRRGHFEALHPVCPVCRGQNSPKASESQTWHLLELAHVEKENEEHILEGAIHCSNPNCLREFPIIDGIPILVANIRQFVSDQILSVYGRRDLSEFTESILGDCCGPNSAFDQTRQHLSSYAWDHYGDLDPLPRDGDTKPGSVLRLFEAGCDLARLPTKSSEGPNAPDQNYGAPALELGCSVGRNTFALAAKTGSLTLGVDLHFAKLRLAAAVLRNRKVCYPLRRVGIVYERREFPVNFPESNAVDFWACDASALPFGERTFAFAIALNLLDCVAAPRDLLASLEHVLQTYGRAVLSCPYDWSPSATAVENWLGGHSQRGPTHGSPEAVLKSLLTRGSHPGSLNTLTLLAEREAWPWQVRLHDRSSMTYQAHLFVAQKR